MYIHIKLMAEKKSIIMIIRTEIVMSFFLLFYFHVEHCLLIVGATCIYFQLFALIHFEVYKLYVRGLSIKYVDFPHNSGSFQYFITKFL